MNLATFDPANASNSEKCQVQQALKDAGYYQDEVDGKFYDHSKDALRRYRLHHAATPAAVVAAVAANAPGSLTTVVLLILACFKQYVGLVEKVPNKVWYDPKDGSPARLAVARKFAAALLDVGCEPGWAYCISAARAVWKEAYTRAGRLAEFLALDKLMSVSVMGSFNALKAAGRISLTPAVGAILFLQHIKNGEATDEGHAVIVIAVYPDHVVCGGANTSPAAGDVEHERNGDGVYSGKVYVLDFKQSHGGLLARGFLNPQ